MTEKPKEPISSSIKKNRDWIIAILGIIATVLAAGLGAAWGTSGSFDLWQKQNSYEKQNVAQALSIEITSMKDKIDFYANGYKSDLIERKVTPSPILQPFYSNNGIYFSFQKEIATFNPKLSSSLFIFYNDLIQAEYYRNVVNEKSKIISEHPNYRTRIATNPFDVDTSKILQNFRVNDNSAKLIIWEGIDPNLTDAENYEIAEGRIANTNLKQAMVNASEMIPGILSQLNDKNSL
jgi:hypothetical protein